MAALFYRESGTIGLYGLDFSPCRSEFTVFDPVLKNADSASPLYHPANKREEINDQKGRRKDKVSDVLASVEDDQHRQKKDERNHRDDCRPLEKNGRRRMGADKLTEVLVRCWQFVGR